MSKSSFRRGRPELHEDPDNKFRKRFYGVATVALLIALLPVAVWLISKAMVPRDREFHIPLPGADQDSESYLMAMGQKMVMSFVQTEAGEFIILNPESTQPILALRLFKRGAWAKRNPFFQKAVCTYIQSVVPQARVLVSSYLPEGKETPNYDYIYRNVQNNLCSSCWAVVEGRGTNPKYLVAGGQVLRSIPNSNMVLRIQDINQRKENNEK